MRTRAIQNCLYLLTNLVGFYKAVAVNISGRELLIDFQAFKFIYKVPVLKRNCSIAVILR